MDKKPIDIKAQTPPSRYFEDPVFSFNKSAVVMLNTTFFNFEFAMALNSSYGLKLLRIDDCPVGDAAYPCFIYHDDTTLLSFVMLDRSPSQTSDPVFDLYDKMLIVRGRDALQFQQQFYDDVTTRIAEPPADELLQHEHWLALSRMSENIIDAATFSFQSPNGTPLTSLHPDTQQPMPRKLTTYLGRMKQFLTSTFQTFEWHLSNPDELE